MKQLFTLLFSAITGILCAQTFEIPAGAVPFYRVLEWKGQGAILMSRDPSFNQKQVHLTLVGNDGKSVWQEQFSPNEATEFFYISEDGGRYAYFLEQLELKGGKVYFHQLNIAGNIKSNNVNFTTALKKVGDFQPDDLRLVDIVTTEKALVYLFTHTDKSTDKRTTIAVAMTHHNFLAYATIVSENVTASSKVEDQVSWYIAGESGESFVYAARTHAGKDAGWLVKQFSVKGELQSQQNYGAEGLSFTEHERVGFATRGSALLNRVEPKEKGTLLVNNGIYYVGGIEVSGTTAKLATYAWKDKSWKLVASSPISSFNPKKTVQAGYFPMKEGIGWYVKSGVAEGHFHSFTNATGIVSGVANQQMDNPSRLLTDQFAGKMIVGLPTKWLLFDPKLLPASSKTTAQLKANLAFEYVAR